VSARSKAWVCGRSLAGIVGSNPTGGHGCLSVVSVVCCQVEVSATGRSLAQRSPTECGVSECDREVGWLNLCDSRQKPLNGFCVCGTEHSATI
jgi:hypothetical protein